MHTTTIGRATIVHRASKSERGVVRALDFIDSNEYHASGAHALGAHEHPFTSTNLREHARVHLNERVEQTTTTATADFSRAMSKIYNCDRLR